MILALKTADFTTQAWLTRLSGELVGQLEWESGRALSEELLGRLLGLLHQHSTELTDLTGLIIFSGPGSFTSLRIGHTVMNALADSLGVPVVGAAGEDWRATGLQRLESAKPGRPALPEYGAEAHITRPKS